MVAKANAGYSKEQVDITNENKGRKSSYYNLKTSETVQEAVTAIGSKGMI
jgi:hypothetical protein